MSRTLAIVVLCCAAPAHAAWTQIEEPADITTWAQVTLAPAFADSVPLVSSTGPQGNFYFQSDVFWLDFSFNPGFQTFHERLGKTVINSFSLGFEALAGVHALTIERLGDIQGSEPSFLQAYRITSAAGVREFTQEARTVPESGAFALAGVGGLVLWRRRLRC